MAKTYTIIHRNRSPWNWDNPRDRDKKVDIVVLKGANTVETIQQLQKTVETAQRFHNSSKILVIDDETKQIVWKYGQAWPPKLGE
jgi:hypothetical protein